MGFQGQLSTVNLTDMFQTLHMNNQTGTLSVSGGEVVQHIYFERGQLSMASAPRIDDHPFLLNALLRKNLLSLDQVLDLNKRLPRSGKNVRELVAASGFVPPEELDEACAWCMEELICPVFEWQDGDFTFTDGGPVPDLLRPDVVSMGENKLQTTTLVLEATRRGDEWKRIQEIIPEPAALYVVDNAAEANVDNDPDVLKVVRYLDGKHTIDDIAHTVGVARFDTFAIVSQLILSGVARPRSAQEVVDDADVLIKSGDLGKASELLESALQQSKVPEVIRRLAEVCAQLNQVPRAVELYLELIQQAQDSGQLDQALADLDTVLKLSPDDPELHFDRAQVLAELNQPEESAKAYVAAAQTYLSMKNVNQAIDSCHRAKNMLPRAPDPHRFLAKAYLMEGQTDSAILEYKSLWHALLTSNRPRKALEMLRQILETDCKYNAIKEQINKYAQGSDEIRTGNAKRLLIYTALAGLLIWGGIKGYEYFDNEIVKANGNHQLKQLKADMAKEMDSLRHPALIEKLNAFNIHYSDHKDLTQEADKYIAEVRADYERRADDLLKVGAEFLAAKEIDKARDAFTRLKAFEGTVNSGKAANLLHACDIEDYKKSIRSDLEEIKKIWDMDEWEQAAVKLTALIERKNIPEDARAELVEMRDGWDVRARNAEAQYRRGERLERQGRKDLALSVYKLAMNSVGETYQAKARERLTQLENQYSQELAKLILDAAQRGDDKQAFAKLDDLKKLSEGAFSGEVQATLTSLALPYVINVDSPFAVLAVKPKGQAEQIVKAPDNTEAGWTHRLTWHPSDSLVVEARRPGFTTQPIVINAETRKSISTVTLKRGPQWQTTLGAVPTSAPVASGKFILLCTNKPTLEIIDSGLGSNKAMSFPDSVSEFDAAPFLFRDRAYLVIDGHVVAIDINTRLQSWSYPQDKAAELNQLNPGSLWVQEHDLIQNQVQVFAGSASGALIALGVDGITVTAYPSSQLEYGITGAPMVDHFDAAHSVLYVPTASALMAFDSSSVTEHTPLKKLYDTHTRGELIGRPIKAAVAGKPAILVTDNSGIVMAIDADPTVSDAMRVTASWPLEGTTTQQPAHQAGKPVAYVSVTEGRVLALDLDQPGQLLWRFPAQGNLAPLRGAPVIGRNGVYVADANGILHCIDPDTGAERWRVDCGSPVMNGILAYDGCVYVGTKGGSLLCFVEGEL